LYRTRTKCDLLDDEEEEEEEGRREPSPEEREDFGFESSVPDLGRVELDKEDEEEEEEEEEGESYRR
jgi:hypothetical protein